MLDTNWMYLLSFFTTIANFLVLPKAWKYFKQIQPIAHPHFCKIFFHIYACIFIFFICTMIMAISLMFSQADPIFVTLYSYTNYPTTLSQNTLSALFLILFLERLFATLNRTTYEKTTHNWIIYLLIFVCYLFGLWNIFAWNIWSYAYFMGRVCYGVDILAVVGTFILWKINQKLKKLHPSSHLMLTKRYQIFENIRTIRFALPYLSIGNFGIIFGGLVSEYFGPSDKSGALFYFCIINLFIPFLLGYEELHNLVFNNEIIQARLSRLSRFRFHRIGPAESSIAPNDFDYHFEQLKKSWN